MIVDYQSLLNYDLNGLDSCRQAWQDVIEQNFAVQQDTYQQQVVAPVNDGSWTGPAAVSGQKGVERSRGRLAATRQYLNTVVQAMNGAYAGLAAAQGRCSAAVRLAQSAGLAVDDNGTIAVQGGPADWFVPPIVPAMTAQLMLYQARFMAYTVDSRVCPILGYANKFGSNDTGTWQQDAATDGQNAHDTMTELPHEMIGIATDEPALPKDTEPQPYACQSPGYNDYTLWTMCTTGGLAYFYSHFWNNAGDLFKHWLGGTGMSYFVDPSAMVFDMPTFGATVDAVFLSATNGVYDTGWRNYSPGNNVQSEDWYYALNDFRYRVIGLVMTDDQGFQYVESTVGVKKPYVFGPPRTDINTPAGPLRQADLQHLHSTGLAQNYVVQGISHHSNF